MSRILPLVSFGILVLASTSVSAPTGSATASATKLCVQLQIPVPVVATNYHYDQPQVDSNIDAMDWTVNVTTWSSSNFTARITGPVNINRTFDIGAQLCVPLRNTSKSSILQIATPGLGFGKEYFDVEVDPQQYSYVDAAVNKGYSILSYDRLGTGASEKPDAYDDVQIPVEIEILAGLTSIAHGGKLISSFNVSSTTSDASAAFDFLPTKIVHVGHSYGSYINSLMLIKYPDLIDGAIFTGLYPNNEEDTDPLNVLNYNHAFASEIDPVRFAEYGSGYFVLDNEETLQKLFFQKATLDPALLTYAESIKQPEAIGEYSSEEGNPLAPAPNYKGPLMFFVGEFDNFICNGNCSGIYNEIQARELFPGVAEDNLTYYLQPNTGHASMLSTNASAGYEVMLQFLDSRGL
ncbi:Alpha/Beta hydrolase protein [Xylariales sp. PMI_506]|nr:Alpha/Beta hydrolase protein [Xylariales sp. PMI_506]